VHRFDLIGQGNNIALLNRIEFNSLRNIFDLTNTHTVLLFPCQLESIRQTLNVLLEEEERKEEGEERKEGIYLCEKKKKKLSCLFFCLFFWKRTRMKRKRVERGT